MVTKELWDKVHESELYHHEYPSINAQAFLKYHVKTMSNRCILDHGCGQGRHAFYFAKFGLDVFAIDSSKSVLSRLRAKDIHDNIKTQLADFNKLPFLDNKFDYI